MSVVKTYDDLNKEEQKKIYQEECKYLTSNPL